MLLFFFMAMWCSPFRGCWDALFILGPLNLCAVSRCWGIDRAQWWTGSVSPAANQKVNSLSIEEGKWPPGLQPAHLSRAQQLKCNRFWLCLRAYRTPAFCVSLLFMSLSILILSFNAFLYPRIISLENFCSHLWHLKRRADKIWFGLKVTGHYHVFFLPLATCFCIVFLSAPLCTPSYVHFSAESLRQSLSTLNWKVILLWPRWGYMCDWVIKITSKYSKGAIIYWCMKDTKEKAALLLLIIKNALENTMYGNEKTVDSPFKWPDLLKLLWRQ